mgnify:CR=1 FL=1
MNVSIINQIITLYSIRTALVLGIILSAGATHSQDDNSDEPNSFRELCTEGGYHMEYERFNLAVPVNLDAEKLQPDYPNTQS